MIKKYIGLHVKYTLLLTDLMKFKCYLQILEKYSKFYRNLSSGSGVVSCERTDEQTDMTKLTVASRNSANAPKNSYLRICILLSYGYY
jgi:hypothetical protein